jgi:putative thioredoxin
MSYDVTNFEQEVLQKSHEIPVVVDFWAEWCGPCRILGPTLERLARENGESWALAKVDTERLPEVAERYQVRSIPNVKLFVDGAVAGEFVGALPEYQVRRWLEKALPGKFAKELAQAEQLLKAGKSSEAHRLLDQIVQADPQNDRARVFLAHLTLFKDPAEAARLVENIEEPEFSEITESIRTIGRLHDFAVRPESLPPGAGRERYREAIRSLFAEDFDGALNRFIDVIRSDRSYDDDGARKACIAIFKVLGEEHSVTLKHRREFSSALYV